MSQEAMFVQMYEAQLDLLRWGDVDMRPFGGSDFEFSASAARDVWLLSCWPVHLGIWPQHWYLVEPSHAKAGHVVLMPHPLLEHERN